MEGTSVPVEPASADRKLATGNGMDGRVGHSSYAIRTTLPRSKERDQGTTTISAEFQSARGARTRVRLFDANGKELASRTQAITQAKGTCGLPGRPRGKITVAVQASGAVAYAVFDVLPPQDPARGSYVFVIDDVTVTVEPRGPVVP